MLTIIEPINKEIREINIPDTINIDGINIEIVEIYNSAFADCERLGSVTIEDSIVIIGDLALYGCSVLNR